MTGTWMRAAALTLLAAIGVIPCARADLTISSRPTKNVTCSSGVCTATAKKALLNVVDLTSMLGSGDVTVSTGGVAKDIDVFAAFSWTATSRLTLDADRSVEVNQPVTVAGSGALTISTNGGKHLDIAFSGDGSIVFWDLSSSLIINGGSYTLVGSIAQLADDVSQNNEGLYALARSYDASADGTYDHAPVPMLRIHGVVEGLGNVISGLSVQVAAQAASAGLFSRNGGTIRDIGLQNVAIAANGHRQGKAGGLVALNKGSIINSYATGTVSSAKTIEFHSYAGGLVGTNEGLISHSYAGVSVTSFDSGGGLVALNDYSGTIEASYASGSVVSGNAGGLVGRNNRLIDQSYASGSVQGTNFVGGMVGLNDGRIENVYATGSATGANTGGLIGLNEGEAVSVAYSTGQVSGTGFVGGLIGWDAGHTANSYWDLETSGVSDPSQGAGDPPNDPGVTGLTTAQFQAGLPQGFDPKVWAQQSNVNGGFPYLRALPPN